MISLAELVIRSGTRPRRGLPKLAHNGSHTVTDVSFSSRCVERIQLSGWLIEPHARPRGIVILCHGHLGTRLEMYRRALLLSDNNFTTLTFDFRARGDSGGDRCTIGVNEMYDVLGAIDFIGSCPRLHSIPIYVIGNSMGGSAAIKATAESPSVAGVVAEAPYADLRVAIQHRLTYFLGPMAPDFIGKCISQQPWLKTVFDCEMPIDAILRIAPRPILLITDGLDVTCPRSESDRLWSAASEPKFRWIAPLAPHVSAFTVYPNDYMRRVLEFFSACERLGHHEGDRFASMETQLGE